MFEALHALEASFDFQAVMAVHHEHLEVPIFAISVYMIIIFWLPDQISKPFNLRSTMAVWNLALSVFSIVGASRLVPELWNDISTTGVVNSMCEKPASELHEGSGLFMMLFIYSKFFELLDTVFLVINKRPVIFLHWFHHVTVLLYCWMSYGQATSTGLWFAAMNYCVHSIMYFYYFLMIFRSLRPMVRIVAPVITTIQITQMVGGLVVSGVAGYKHITEGKESCKVPPSNWKLGGAMYLCYFILFAILFLEKFILKNKGAKANVCNATDSAGMFRGDSQQATGGARKKKD